MLTAQGNIDPGRLDRRVTLSSPTETRDSMGGVETAWTEVATVWASKAPQAGGRLFAAEGKRYEATLSYRIRHRTDCAAGWRLTHGDDVFEITAVAEIGRRHFLELACRALDQTTGDDGSANGIETFAGETIETFAGDPIEPMT